MMRIILMLLSLITIFGSVGAYQETATLLEPLTKENVRWLVPLISTRIGERQHIAWMPDDTAIAVELASGVWVFPTQIMNQQPVIDQENGRFLSGLSQITLNVTRTRMIGLEIIPDIRPDQPVHSNIWDVSTGKIIVELTNVATITALSPDGLSIAVIDNAERSRLEIYSLESGQRTDVIVAPENITGVGYSHDGSYLAFTGQHSDIDGTRDAYLMVYDLAEKQTTAFVAGNDKRPVDAYFVPVFSPEGQYIFLTNNSRVVQYWSFNPFDGQLNDISDQAQAIKLSNDTEGIVRLPDERSYVLNPLISTSGATIPLNTPSDLFIFSNPTTIRYDPEGNTVYYSNTMRGYAPIETFDNFQMVPRPYELDFFNQLMSPDRLNIVGYFIDSLWLVNLRNPNDYSFVSQAIGEQIFYPTISRDFQFVAYRRISGVEEPKTIIRRIDTGEEIIQLEALDMPVFSRNGRMIAGVSSSDAVLIWDVSANQKLSNLPLSNVSQFSKPLLEFSPDGRQLTAVHENILTMWDTNTGELIVETELEMGFIVAHALRYSEDGNWLGLFGGQTAQSDAIYLWRVQDLESHSLSPIPFAYELNVNVNSGTGLTVTTTGEMEEPLEIVVQQSKPEAILQLRNTETNDIFTSFFLSPWEFAVEEYENDGNRQNPAGTFYVNDQSSAIYDAATDKIVSNIGMKSTSFHQIELDPSGYTLATTDGINAMLWGVPSISEDPSELICEGALPTRLKIGNTASVTGLAGSQEVRVRAYPNGTIIDSINPYTTLKIVRGPICTNGILWWGFETSNNSQYGWIAESAGEGDYLLTPQ